jgi:hypothetical protein
MIKLTEIDLSKGKEHNHPDIKLGKDNLYLAKIGKNDRFGYKYYVGYFQEQWYGLHFACDFGMGVGLQFDTPGWNSSRWSQLWEFKDVKKKRKIKRGKKNG